VSSASLLPCPLPVQIHATFSGVVAALADRPHLPSQERLHQEAAPTGAAPLVGAGSADYVSGTEGAEDILWVVLSEIGRHPCAAAEGLQHECRR
jgi:hypothetical protein